MTRIGLGFEPVSNVTKRAMFGWDGSAIKAEASARNISKNSDSDTVRAADASYDGTFSAKRSADGSCRSSMRTTTSTLPPPPLASGRTT